jgi:GntR family transcriptional regulator, transcriptional repressor for pyruvate dehydrogenase complex
MTNHDSEDLPSRIANLADAIFDDLQGKILRGEFHPGEKLLGERELAAEYGTNRNTLREAVRKLEQAHMVTVRHGRGVIVRDFRRTGTLELLSPYLNGSPHAAEAANLVKDILEPRVLLLEHATRVAARNANPEDTVRLRELAVLLVSAFESREATVVAQGSQRWLDALVDATHSVAIRWIANPFLEALRQTLERLPMLWILEPSYPDHLKEVVDAIEQGDDERAAQSTRTYYQRVDGHLCKLLQLGLRTPLKPVGAPPTRTFVSSAARANAQSTDTREATNHSGPMAATSTSSAHTVSSTNAPTANNGEVRVTPHVTETPNGHFE